MKGSHLVENNIDTKTWTFDNTNCKYEHVMHKFLDSYPQPLHGWETRGSPICSFEMFFVISDMEGSMTFE